MAAIDFINGLKELGFQITELEASKISFPFKIPVGRFIGTEICLGFIVPDDFPFVPPSGPHVSPLILPKNPNGGPHPSHGVHDSPFGTEWEYWSRPFPDWNNTDKTAKTYMTHINHLMDTQ